MSQGTGIWEGHETYKMPMPESPAVYMKMGLALKVYHFLFYQSDILCKTDFILSDALGIDSTGIEERGRGDRPMKLATAQRKLAELKVIHYKPLPLGNTWYALCDFNGNILEPDWWV